LGAFEKKNQRAVCSAVALDGIGVDNEGTGLIGADKDPRFGRNCEVCEKK